MPHLNIGGFQPLSSVDYPDHLAAVVFLQGCPWACHYCHNTRLHNPKDTGEFDWPQLLSVIMQRQSFIDAVVFSGGEPLCQSGLIDAIKSVKKIGLKVGLHTAGIYPERLASMLPLLDWVGLDIKQSPQKYDDITHVKQSWGRVDKCLDLLVHSTISFECRTTLSQTFMSLADLDAIFEVICSRGVKEWVLQRANLENCLDSSLVGHSASFELFSSRFDKYKSAIAKFSVR